jgi:hypothetical protein
MSRDINYIGVDVHKEAIVIATESLTYREPALPRKQRGADIKQ